MPWEDEAACRGCHWRYPGTWIIEPTSELATPQSVVTKLEICDGCPVRSECLRFALSAESFTPVGIWGGTTSIERVTLAPRPPETATISQRSERRAQIERAEEILTATHAERLARWRVFAQEARKARERKQEPFRLSRGRVTEPLRAALDDPAA